MSRHLETELEQLKRKLLSLSTIVEEVVQKSVDAVANHNEILAREVIRSDEIIDDREVELEEDCLKILALHQPVAIDLRFVILALKMNNDLERIGDLSVNMAERTLFLSKYKHVPVPFDFKKMADMTRSMLRDAIDSLIKMDAQIAHQVCTSDDEVDKINREMYVTAFRLVKEQPEHVEAFMNYISVSRHLERIADYATNIAEDVIYMIEGTIVRHSPEEIGHRSNHKK